MGTASGSRCALAGRWLAVLALSALALRLPVGAAAQDIPLRAGEHAGFTRVVLYLDSPTPAWELGRMPGGYGLWLALPPEARIDTSRVFERIPRSRLGSLTPASGSGGRGLILALACNTCHARAFEAGGGLLVIDIADGPPPGPRFEGRSRLAPPSPSGGPSPPPAPAASRTTPDPATADIADATGATRHADAAGPAPATTPEEDSEEGAAALAALLAGQIASLAAPPRAQGGQDDDPAQAPLPLPDTGAAGPAGLAAAAHLGLRNPAAPDTAPPLAAEGLREALARAVGCLPDTAFDLAGWADDTPFPAQLAALTDALTDGADRAEPEAAMALARLYLHFGLGQEAAALLSGPLAEAPEAPVLSDIAAIMEGGVAPEGTLLAGQAGCPGASALWSALALRAHPPGLLAENRDRDLLRHFSALPAPLRRHLGPILARRLARGGDLVTAGRVAEAVARAPGPPEPGMVVMAAELALLSGRPLPDRAALRAVASGNGPGAAEAMALLLRARLARGEIPSPEMRAAAGALAADRGAAHGGQALHAALAEAHLAAGALAEAMSVADALHRLPQPSAADPGGALEDRALEGVLPPLAFALSEAPAALRARLVVEYRSLMAALEPEGARSRLAHALVAQGAPGLALDLVARWPGFATSPAGRMAAAEAYLAQASPAEALAHLSGLSGHRAAALRARAHLARGDEEAALIALRRPRAEAALAEPSAREPQPDQAEGELAAARALIARAGARRAWLEAGLSALGTARPGPPDPVAD